MAVTNYHSVGGVILGESAGGVRTDYAPNALGSVAATVDQNGAVVNQYAYKPYGSQLSKTGAGADPSFRWGGISGFRTTTIPAAIFAKRGSYRAVTGTYTSAVKGNKGSKRYVLTGVIALDIPPVCGSEDMPWSDMIPIRVELGGALNTYGSSCGLASFRTYWHPRSEKKPGVVIQKVTYKFTVNNCDGTDIQEKCPKEGKYLEAWYFTSNKKQNDDTFAIDVRGHATNNCFCGSAEMERLAAYYEGCQPGPPIWAPNGCMSGNLPAIDHPTVDVLNQLKIGPTGKFLQYRFNCCLGTNLSHPYWRQGGVIDGASRKVTDGYCWPGTWPDCKDWSKQPQRSNCGCAEPCKSMQGPPGV